MFGTIWVWLWNVVARAKDDLYTFGDQGLVLRSHGDGCWQVVDLGVADQFNNGWTNALNDCGDPLHYKFAAPGQAQQPTAYTMNQSSTLPIPLPLVP